MKQGSGYSNIGYNLIVKENTMTYEEYLNHWLDRKRKLVKDSTYANYSLKINNHLKPSLGKLHIQEINSALVQELVFTWLESGSCLGAAGLRLKSVKDIVMVLRTTLKDAYKEGLRTNVPLEIVYPRNTILPRQETLSAKEYKKLLTFTEMYATPHNLGIGISLQTGMRIGEICALQWQDIDLENRLISVHKTLSRIYGRKKSGESYNKIIISTPKTPHSQRVIPLSKNFAKILKSYARENGKAYVLTGSTKYTEPSNFRVYYYKLLKKLCLPKINFHGLRHTFATRLIEAGVDCKTVSELLGHASVNITLNLYVHPNMEQKRKAIEKLY